MAAKKKTGKKASKKESPTKKVVRRAPKKVTISDRLSASDREAALIELMGELNQADRRVIAHGYDVPNTYELRRPSGIAQLDIDTGGGLPAGGCCYLSGPDGSGKTHLLYMYMAQHQKIYGNESYIAFAPMEAQFDFKRARACGMRVAIPKRMIDQWKQERFERGMPDFTPEEINNFESQIGKFELISGRSGEEVCDAILRSVNSRVFGIIGVDSVNGLMPEANLSKELDEEQKRAAHATLMTKFFNHYIPMTNSLNTVNETTLIFIQQVRSNASKATAPSYMQKYLKDWATTGAWAARHYKLIDIIVWSGEKIKQQVGGKKEVIGKEIKWELDKGKAGAHDNVTGSSALYYERGIDPVSTFIVTGTKRGIIRETPNGVLVINPETGKPIDLGFVPTIQSLYTMMSMDLNFDLAVRREVLASANIHCLYK